MIKKSRMLFNRFSTICLVIFFQSIIISGVVLEDSFLLNTNSDLLYAEMFLYDISESFSNFLNWNLTPAPYLFPDLFLYFMIRQSEIGLSLLIYIFIFQTFLSIIFYKLLTQENIDEKVRIFETIFLISILFFSLLTNKKLFYFYLPTYHSSLYLFGAILFFKFEKKYIYYFVYIFSFLIGFSDSFVLLNIYIPILLFFSLLKYFNLKHHHSLKFIVIAFLFSILGRVFLQLLASSGWILVPDPPVIKTVRSILRHNLLLENILRTFEFFIQEVHEFKISFLLFISFLGILIYKYIIDFSNTKEIILFVSLLVCFILIFLFQGVFGIWIGYRYMWFYYIIPPLGISYFILKKKFFTLNYHYIYSILFISIGFFIKYDSLNNVYTNYKSYYYFERLKKNPYVNYPEQNLIPESVRCILELKGKYDLSFGISDYWNAKYITFFSNNRLLVNAFQEDLSPYFWINNKKYYEYLKDLHEYDFVLIHNLNKNVIFNTLGRPIIIEKCREEEVWIYKPRINY